MQQICFVEDGVMHCNLVHRNGKLTATKSGKWWSWPVKTKKRSTRKSK